MKEIAESDMLVMAAATELLRACKYALKKHQEIVFIKHGHVCDSSCDICPPLKEAIAKAEGKIDSPQ